MGPLGDEGAFAFVRRNFPARNIYLLMLLELKNNLLCAVRYPTKYHVKTGYIQAW